LTPEESDFEAALGALMPLRPDLEVRKIWMEAQRRKWRAQVLVWRGVAAVLAAGLIVSLLLRGHDNPASVRPISIEPGRQVNQPVAPQVTPAPARQSLPVVLSGDDYLALRSRVVAFGIDALPQATPATGTFAPIRPLELPADSSQPHTTINIFGPLWRGGRS